MSLWVLNGLAAVRVCDLLPAYGSRGLVVARPASSFWHKISGLMLADRVQQGVAQDLSGTAEAEGFVRPDLVEHGAVGLGLAAEVLDGGYLLVHAVEILVLERAEAALAHPVLARGLRPGPDVQQLRA